MMRHILAAVLLAAALNVTAAAQTARQQLWPGVWISLPKGAKVERWSDGPIPEILKQARVSLGDGSDGFFYVDLWRQRSGIMPYGAAFDRRLKRQDGYRNVSIRERKGSYAISYNSRKTWYYTRKIRMSSRQMVKASLSVALKERRSGETRRLLRILDSISLSRR